MNEQSKKERREHERIPIWLKIEYTEKIEYSDENMLFTHYSKNISKGGTFIKTEHPLSLGTEFFLHLSSPDINEPIKVRAKVMWVNTKENINVNSEIKDIGMGVRFIYDSDEQREAFFQIIEKLLIRNSVVTNNNLSL